MCARRNATKRIIRHVCVVVTVVVVAVASKVKVDGLRLFDVVDPNVSSQTRYKQKRTFKNENQSRPGGKDTAVWLLVTSGHASKSSCGTRARCTNRNTTYTRDCLFFVNFLPLPLPNGLVVASSFRRPKRNRRNARPIAPDDVPCVSVRRDGHVVSAVD